MVICVGMILTLVAPVSQSRWVSVPPGISFSESSSCL
jgi:hypothetical protein